MTRHLRTCRGHPEDSPAAAAGSPVKCFHVVVEGQYARDYWMHLAIPVKAPLSKLDSFLRFVWLECCGHMSAFTIGGQRYAGAPMHDLEERGMNVTLDRVLEVGLKFFHEYDYGSTTHLALRVAGVREEETPKRGVKILAANDPPPIPCDVCGGSKLATEICTECAWSGGGWLCEDCAANHECGSEMLLPVVNSPRTGVCGYAG